MKSSIKKPFMWHLGAKLFQWIWDSKRYHLYRKRGKRYNLCIVDELYKQEESL